MDIFYPTDDFECFVQLVSFFTWTFVARLGWRYADWALIVFRDFFRFLRQLLHRPRR